jgi:hypothetical protein
MKDKKRTVKRGGNQMGISRFFQPLKSTHEDEPQTECVRSHSPDKNQVEGHGKIKTVLPELDENDPKWVPLFKHVLAAGNTKYYPGTSMAETILVWFDRLVRA